MERINLPSQAMGGFDYEESLILFRRLGGNNFELRVYPWDSDSARAYVEPRLSMITISPGCSVGTKTFST
jgi:hypothetical protein